MTLHSLDLTRLFRLIHFLVLAAVSSFAAAVGPPVWIDSNTVSERQVHLYFFWTSSCPHRQAARPFVEALPARHPWLVLHSHNLTADPNAADAYVSMAESLGQDASSVGSVFLFFSGLIHFLFMAAWINVFRWLGEIALVTTAARGGWRSSSR